MLHQETGGPQPLTVSEIAEALREPRHRIEYLLDARRIRPSRRIGNCKVYPPAVVDFLRVEIARLNGGREGVL